MHKRMFSLTGLGLVVLLAHACTATPNSASAGSPQASDPAHTSASATGAPDAETAATPPAATAKRDDKVVCRKYDVTGSRVLKEKVCKTRLEWKHTEKDAQDFMKDIERRGSTQPGGETLSPGG